MSMLVPSAFQDHFALLTELVFRMYNKLILGHPRLWMTIIALLAVIAALQARHFKLDASSESLVLENDAA
ncbi:MAG: hypothetical protein V3S24_17185, partial [Candidatus Tectomicrobia bacterium]